MGSTDRQLTLDQQDAEDREKRYVKAMLADRGVPERLHYAAGVMLDTQDFEDEQAYHRAQLGRALTALFGFGTLAGLRVRCPLRDNAELEIKVTPGLALDRLGRLIEVRRDQCLKVTDWLAARAGSGASTVEQQRRNAVITAVTGSGSTQQLLLDVWLRYQPCAHGRTPAFAAGPFNATDYTVPARLADGFALTLELAADPDDPAAGPLNRLPYLDVKIAELQSLAAAPEQRIAVRTAWMVDSVLDAWVKPAPEAPDRLPLLAEHSPDAPWHGVFLARVPVPVAATDTDPYPTLDATRLVDPQPADQPPTDIADNSQRPIVFMPTAWRGQAA